MPDLEPPEWEIERSVLAVVLNGGPAPAGLKPEMFGLLAHGRIFAAALALRERNAGVDLKTVTYELRKRGDLEAVGGMAVLSALIGAPGVAENVAGYAAIVVEAHEKRMKVRALLTELDALGVDGTKPAPKHRVGSSRPPEGAEGSSLALPDAEPWPEPVNGAALLDEIVAAIRRFIVLSPDAAEAAAMWATLSYYLEHADCAPRLILTSPTRECGKSRLLMVLAALVRRPIPTSGISPAATFRVIEAMKPTLLVDEVDNSRLKENDEMKALLNSGHTRGAAWVLRCEGDNHEPHRFSTWCLIALAGIGKLPDTVMSRGIVVRLQRKPRSVRLPRLRERQLHAGLEAVRRKLARWARDIGPRLAETEPDLPDALDGRVADNWTPLIAIADAAGGAWPERARRAALTLSGQIDGDEGTPGETLLADLRDLFAERGTDRLSSEDVAAALGRMETRPWPDWRGRPITTRGIAHLLKPFGVEPGSVRFGDGTRKGYLRDWFEGAWSRYLPPYPEQAEQANNGAGETTISHPEQLLGVPDQESVSDPHGSRPVPDVPATRGVEGDEGLTPEHAAMLDRHGWEPLAPPLTRVESEAPIQESMFDGGAA